MAGQLRWRRESPGRLVARAHHAGPTYEIRSSYLAGQKPLHRLYVDGVELTDAAGCTLRFVKYRAATHAAEAAR